MNFSKYCNKKIECLKEVHGIKLRIFDHLDGYRNTNI